ncbi:MAG: EAL domain-containing protein [Spirochaetaceae bacterium]|nr:EAL domain-containing protein [Spirochaetaceae bacterium]
MKTQSVITKFGDNLVTLLNKLSSNSYVIAIRQGFLFALPALIIFSYAFLALELLSLRSTVAINNGIWVNFLIYIYNGTAYTIALLILMGIAYNIARHHEHNADIDITSSKPLLTTLITICCYFAYIPPFNNYGVVLHASGLNNVLPAIIIGIVAPKMFYAFTKFKRLRINAYFDISYPMATKVLNTLAASLLVISFFAFLHTVSVTFNFRLIDSIFHMVAEGVPPAESGNLIRYLYYTVFRNVLLFFGVADYGHLHSSIELFSSFNFGQSFLMFQHFVFLGGSGATLGLLVSMLIVNKNNKLRWFAQVSLMPSLFGIGQILLYGLPLIFNPVFIIPFILTPIILLLTSFLAIHVGFIDLSDGGLAVQLLPIFFSGYTAAGSWRGVALQFINLIISIAIYLPFTLAYKNLNKRDTVKDKHDLINASINKFVTESSYITARNDSVGGMAQLLSADLRKAIARNELYLQYQPQVDVAQLENQRVVGVEALLRWTHPVHGVIPPPTITTLAAEGNFLSELSSWVAEEAAKTLRNWRNKGLTGIWMSINLSAIEMDDITTAKKIIAILKKYDIPHELFRVEITEEMALTINENVKNTVGELANAKIPIAIDDFGMGHSSAIYLKHFPISTLKIDRVISEDIVTNQRSSIILDGLVDICKRLNITMVVEYTEDYEQIAALIEKGCHIFQGYFFSRPLMENDAYDFIIRNIEKGKLLVI